MPNVTRTHRTSAARKASTSKKPAALPPIKAKSTRPMLVDVKVSGKRSIDVDIWRRNLSGLTSGLVLTVQVGKKTVRVDAESLTRPPPGVSPLLWDMTPTAQGLASRLAGELEKAGFKISMDYVGIGESTMRITLK